MKSILRKLTVGILSVVMLFTMASCSYLPPLDDILPSFGKKPSGLYGDIDENGFGYTYKFVGDRVTHSLWNNGKSTELMDANFDISMGKIKMTSSEYFSGSVEEDGRYVVSKSFSSGEDDIGEYIEIGVNTFYKMEESNLPGGSGGSGSIPGGSGSGSGSGGEEGKDPEKDPGEDPEGNPEGDPEEDPEKDPEKDPDDNNNENNNSSTPTPVTMEELQEALTEALDTQNKNFDTTYTLSEVYTEGGRTETAKYSMQIQANGQDRYLKFAIETKTSESGMSQGNSQVVEIWYKNGDSYIKAHTWQEKNGKTQDDQTESIKASGQNFNSVCQNLQYPIASILGMGSDLNSLLTDTSATATKQNGKITYELDCTGKSSALNTLYRMSKAFGVKIIASSFDDANVSYSLGSTDGLVVSYTGEESVASSNNSTVSGKITFKSTNPTISVPSSVSSAEDKGSGYKTWYNSLEGIQNR